MAIKSKHKSIVELLLQCGSSLNGDCGNALYAASEGGREKVVQMLLEKGAEALEHQ